MTSTPTCNQLCGICVQVTIPFPFPYIPRPRFFGEGFRPRKTIGVRGVLQGCNPPTRVGVHSLLFLCSIQNFVTTCQSKIPSPPNSKNLQNPKSKIPKIQNPKSPNSKIQTLHIKICYIMFQKSKIQNPQNPENPKSPKSKIPKISKAKIPTIQNPKSPKSKNPVSPTSKIQNSKSPPKSKIWGVGASHKELQHNDPKSKIQNPQNPKSQIPKIQNLKSPKSKIQNLKSPKSKIQNPPPKSKIWGVGGLT